jgi:hypothetical protein
MNQEQWRMKRQSWDAIPLASRQEWRETDRCSDTGENNRLVSIAEWKEKRALLVEEGSLATQPGTK